MRGGRDLVVGWLVNQEKPGKKNNKPRGKSERLGGVNMGLVG